MWLLWIFIYISTDKQVIQHAINIVTNTLIISKYPFICGYGYDFINIPLNIRYVWTCISNCIYDMKIDLMVMESLEKIENDKSCLG